MCLTVRLATDSKLRHELQRSSRGSRFRLLLYDDVTGCDVKQVREKDELIRRSSMFHRAPISSVVDESQGSDAVWEQMFVV